MAEIELQQQWSDVRDKLQFLVTEYIGALEIVTRGIDLDLLEDEAWNQEFIDKTSYIAMATQMEVQQLAPEQRQEVHDLLMPKEQ